MLRTTRIPIAWLALSALLTAAARADEPAAWPVLPITTSASIAEAPSKASQISYQEDAADDSENSSDAPTSPPSVMGGNNGSSSPSSCGNCCPSVGSCCAECLSQCRGRCLMPFVGVEAAFLAPVMNHGGGGSSYNLQQITPGGTNTIGSYSTSSVNGMVVTPRLWMGLMGPRWGVGVRYWGFSNGTGQSSPNQGSDPGANQGLFSNNYLRLQTLDLEAIRRIPCCGRCLWFSAGVRYGQFIRNNSIGGADVVAGNTFLANSYTGTGFNGVGPTFGLYGLSPVNCCSNWNFFYGGRVSVLFDGNSTVNEFTSASLLNGAGGGSASAHGAYAAGNANAFVGELSLGAQYNHCLQCVPGIAFFRIAAEYQYWHVNGANTSNIVNNSSVATLGSPSYVATSTSFGGNSTLALLGFGISCGFMW